MAGHGLEKRHDIAPHQRLAACDPQFAHAQPNESAAKAVKLFQSQKIFFGQKRHVFRHAIDAAKIAAIRDGQAQIGDGAGKGINQRGCHGRTVSLSCFDHKCDFG